MIQKFWTFTLRLIGELWAGKVTASFKYENHKYGDWKLLWNRQQRGSKIYFTPSNPKSNSLFYCAQIAIRLQLLENANHYQEWYTKMHRFLTGGHVSPRGFTYHVPTIYFFFNKKQTSNCFLHSRCLFLKEFWISTLLSTWNNHWTNIRRGKGIMKG